MNRTLRRLAAVTLVTLAGLSGVVTPARADDGSSAELEQVRAKVSGVFKQIEPKDVEKSPVAGWYTIRKGAIVAYISADGRYLLQGDLIDLDNEVNLSEATRNQARLEMLSGLPDDDMIVFRPENPRFSVTVFTDIDCAFCRRFHSQIDQYLAQGIEVRYLLYPRSGPDSPSWTKAEKVWCADDRNKALTLAKQDKPFKTHQCDASIVQMHYSLGRDVGLQGTPAIVLQDGSLVSGYMPPLELTEALAALND